MKNLSKNIAHQVLFPEPSVHPAKAPPVKRDKRPWGREWKIQEQIKASINQKHELTLYNADERLGV